MLKAIAACAKLISTPVPDSPKLIALYGMSFTAEQTSMVSFQIRAERQIKSVELTSFVSVARHLGGHLYCIQFYIWICSNRNSLTEPYRNNFSQSELKKTKHILPPEKCAKYAQ